MSGCAILVIAFFGLMVLLAAVIPMIDQPSRSSRDVATSPASAVAAADAADGWEVVKEEPAFAPIDGHVLAQNANVRTGAGTRFAVIGSVPQMTQVRVTGREGTWSRVQVHMDGYQRDGYIASQLLHEGSSAEARAIVCDVMQSVRPYSGEVLLQQGRGPHHLTVNAGARDALVKLRRSGTTSLAFYVRAGESGTVQSIPDGTYQIMFATGDGFSRKCLEFVTSMQVISDPSPQTFRVTSDGYAEYYSTGTYTLTTQAGGNFTPQTVDNNSFRE